MYKTQGGAFPDPILNLTWNYKNPMFPQADELLREISGKTFVQIKDPTGKVLLEPGDQLTGFAQLRDDGSTACGNWIYSGSWSKEGNLTARRDPTETSDQNLGQSLKWGFAWPANRRILYNRASEYTHCMRKLGGVHNTTDNFLISSKEFVQVSHCYVVDVIIHQ